MPDSPGGGSEASPKFCANTSYPGHPAALPTNAAPAAPAAPDRKLRRLNFMAAPPMSLDDAHPPRRASAIENRQVKFPNCYKETGNPGRKPPKPRLPGDHHFRKTRFERG